MLLLSSLGESRLLSSDSDKIRSTRLISSSELSRSTNFSVFFCTDKKESKEEQTHQLHFDLSRNEDKKANFVSPT